MKRTHAIVFAILFFFTTATVAPALTMEEERKYGKEINREIRKAAPVNNDPYISLYVDRIKRRLEDKAAMPFPVTLTIIDSESIDAFATMGGYAYITTGLIAMCDKEEALAGVLAHEFSHIKKRHIAKRMEKEKYFNIGMMASTLAALLIGSGQTAGAIMTTSMAGVQQLSLKYSRDDEEEADREGAMLADKVGYGGLGTAEFLRKLRSAGGDALLPQYLLTHPNHEERIVALEKKWQGSKSTIDGSFFPYLCVRSKILHTVPGSGAGEILLNSYLKKKDDPANGYAAALVYSLRGDADKSITIASGNRSPYRDLFLGEVLVNARRFNEAIDDLKDSADPIARYFLARAYEGMGNGKTASDLLQRLSPYGPVFPEIYYRLGMLYGTMGKEGPGYDYLGRFYLETGKYPQARTYLEKAVTQYGINSPQGRDVLQLLETLKDPKDPKNAKDQRPGP